MTSGNRLVSSHATKNGKRYRYYVTSAGTGRSLATPSLPRLWLPAAVIDELVLPKLQSFLSDKVQISRLLRETRCRPAEIASSPKSPAICEFANVGFTHGAGLPMFLRG